MLGVELLIESERKLLLATSGVALKISAYLCDFLPVVRHLCGWVKPGKQNHHAVKVLLLQQPEEPQHARHPQHGQNAANNTHPARDQGATL